MAASGPDDAAVRRQAPESPGPLVVTAREESISDVDADTNLSEGTSTSVRRNAGEAARLQEGDPQLLGVVR